MLDVTELRVKLAKWYHPLTLPAKQTREIENDEPLTQ
jgi:hypothetical protein